VTVGLLTLYGTASGHLGLALKLNCDFVLAANASVIVTGKVLGQPVHITVPVGINDGGLASCALATVTTAVPFAGCLLAFLDTQVDLNLPINVRLGPDYTGCTGERLHVR
jgi:hypothetical protein